jgi:hypothetical protein
MKYIIPQDKLDKIVFKYLDLNLKGLEKRKAKFYDGIVFIHPHEEYGVLGYRNGGTLYIYYELIEEISSTFGLDESESELLIGRWVSDRLQLEVKNTHNLLTAGFIIVSDRLQLE